MPTVDVYNMSGEKVREIDLNDTVFGCEIKPHLLHDVVVWQLANRRAATAKTKTRKEVSGGGTKPYRQKGTGRARAGSNRSPLWRHGGVSFGPNGRKYARRLPKKVRNQALCSALTMKLQENVMKVVDAITLERPKTKLYAAALGKLGMDNSLVVMGSMNPDASLASRNLSSSKLLDVRGLNVYDILKYKGLVLDVEAVQYIEERLKG
ncbi:MAG: 50S ribosomal protein L4 [Deltaproteobacteria bacterium ADurb.BinA179]|jgi:large subunit ribosomal protein L4|nr:50S ribosomal protein L4 [Deltaproteobacteria bacterium]MDI9541400.1 50S ribosomal protein L4 [Pseudomonadota bacterium]OPZ28170.1 MAG: 50S ribosomal protein L4 [Deltaproteobacteria bacterium ADurb.BinA179]HNR50924.1 50S ribosomal protein L4 [Deltaproteobacteria bacterium]HOD70543.1 50S ribosomal protein L4 [Deltaproteobacteria bacterium]